MPARNFDIILREDPAIGDLDLAVITPLFDFWEHETIDWGGNWFAEGHIYNTRVDTAWLRAFFNSNIGRRLVVRYGGIDYYEGQITELELVEGNAVSIRSMENFTNAIRIYYTKVGDNQIDNPSVESSAWAAYGTPTTNEQSADWSAAGVYSQHIVSDGAGDGALIEDGDSTGLQVDEGVTYTCSCVVNVVSGSWTLEVIRTDTSAVLAAVDTPGTGRTWLKCQVPNTTDLGGASRNVDIRLYCADTGEIYADAVVFRAEYGTVRTEWFLNADSIARSGRCERIILEGEMSDSEATANATLIIAENAWVRTRGAGRGSTFRLDRDIVSKEDTKLVIRCMGMSWTLGWTYIEEDLGTGDASTLLAALLDLSEFYTSSGSAIDTNTQEVQLFVEDPTTLWEAIEKILEVGDGAGGAFVCGGYPGLLLQYHARPTTVQYDIVKGNLYWAGGGDLIPATVQPGWALNRDLIIDEPEAGADDIDNPRRVWLESVRFRYDRGEETATWTEES